MASEASETGDRSHGPTRAHWAVVLFVIGHFVTLFVLTIGWLMAIVEIALAGGWSTTHRGGWCRLRRCGPGLPASGIYGRRRSGGSSFRRDTEELAGRRRYEVNAPAGPGTADLL